MLSRTLLTQHTASYTTHNRIVPARAPSRLIARFKQGEDNTHHESGMAGMAEAVKDKMTDAKEAVMGAGTQLKEKATGGRPTVAPSSDFNTTTLTTNTGAPVANNENSLTAGAMGPVLLEDMQATEKLSILHQEKVPERTVHARGFVAKGHFEVTHDITDICCADFLSSTGKKTPVAARLSTVVHERGSPENLRDVRGFSVKFYTQQGNWDFVGNNIPVFFIRDGMQFTDLVHALRPNPMTHIQEGWRILDFLSYHPESANILTWLLDDNGRPENWRSLEGYGVNTFVMVNKEGKETLVKFHFRPQGGPKFMSDEDAHFAGGIAAELNSNMFHSHATYDMYNAIERGEYPEWEFFVQTMDPADQDKFYFDPLDGTKVWPEEEFPLRPVGKMVLDTNIDNFHAENEQIAFSPGMVVPGISFSNDKMLQSRVWSYADAQRYRIGINYQMLPINQPKCPFHNNHNDGAMNFMHKREEINYYPSAVAKKDRVAPAQAVTQSNQPVTGVRTRADYKPEDEFRQPGERYRTFDEDRKKRFQKHVAQWMGDPKLTDEVRNTWFGIWDQVDASLGADLRQKVPEIQAMYKKTGQPNGPPKA